MRGHTTRLVPDHERSNRWRILIATARDARSRVEREKFHVAVVDVKLHGGEDGRSLADHLWKNSKTGVLLVSADHELGPILRRSGHAFLLKPFSLQSLLAMIEAILKATGAK